MAVEDITPSDEDAIIARLKLDAKGGNVQAARELREWLRAQREREQGAESIDTATTYGQLSKAQRVELRGRLLTEALGAEVRVAPAKRSAKQPWLEAAWTQQAPLLDAVESPRAARIDESKD